jgi:membrane protease YdiL (CAAX protease family)
MNANLVSDRPPLISLLRILSLVLAGFVLIGPMFGVMAAYFIYDGDFLAAMSNASEHPDIRYAVLLSQGIASSIGLIFLPWYYLKISERRGLTGFFKNESAWPLVIISLAVAVVAVAMSISPVVEWNAAIEFPEWMSAFGDWARNVENTAAALIKAITSDLTPLSFAFTFIVVAILPAIGEELVFRGLIQTEVQRLVRNPHVAIWATALLFSAFHLQFYGFVPRTLLGAFLGYVYYWSGNLWVPIIAHFFNNGLQLVGLYLFQKGILNYDVESNESAPLSIVATSLVLTVFLLVFFKNYFFSRTTNDRDITQEL